MSLQIPSDLSFAQRERLRLAVTVEQERRRRARRKLEDVPSGWREWCRALFPATFSAPFAARHVSTWEWIDGLEDGVAPSPVAYVDVQPRGGGKTTTAETAVIRVGARLSRRFVLYVRSTQDKANESVQSISAKLESDAVGRYYPTLASRQMTKYGHSRGWRIDMLRCANGFNVAALGLDAAVRGVKLDDYRPDLIILDDIDDKSDSAKVRQRKIDVLTASILPAGATHCAYLVEQNLIYAGGIVASLVDGTAEFLLDRHVSGPHVAVEGLAYEERPDGGYTITGGAATWAGQPLPVCESQINTWGLSVFLRESQQDVDESGGIWDHVAYRHAEWHEVPDLVRGEVWVDPAVTSTDDSDCNGIAAGGLDEAGTIFLTYAWEGIDTPLNILVRAILVAIDSRYTYVGVETDQGGDTWLSVFEQAWRSILEGGTWPHIIDRATAVDRADDEELQALLRENEFAAAFIYRDDAWEVLKRPSFRSAKAGAGHGSKVHRNQQMLSDYERGRVRHVRGPHAAAEKALRRFPNKPLDLADTLYWLWYHLNKGRQRSRIG